MPSCPPLPTSCPSALTAAHAVVALELLAIAWLRFYYFKPSFVRSCLQVVVGGALVLGVGVLIGTL